MSERAPGVTRCMPSVARWALPLAAVVGCSVHDAARRPGHPAVPSAGVSVPAAAPRPVTSKREPAPTPVFVADVPVSEAPPKRQTLPLATLGARQLVARYDPAVCWSAEAALAPLLHVDVVDSGKIADSFEIWAEADRDLCADYLRLIEIGDFDFDGYTDIALPMDHGSPYGTHRYAVLLFRPKSTRYEPAPKLSELTQEYMGMFVVDAKRKRLIASSKAGCCIHGTRVFSVVGDAPVVESSELQTATFEHDGCHVTTEHSARGMRTKITRRACTEDEQ